MGSHGTWASALPAAVFWVSCGGATSLPVGGGGSFSASGQIAGASLPSTEIVGIVETQGSGAGTRTTVGAAITNLSGTCSILQSVAAGGPTPGNVTSFSLSVQAQGAAVPAGTYAINASCGPTCTTFADAVYVSTDANCHAVKSENATSGTIVFTGVTATEIDGSFDVTFGNGDHLTGSFTAPVCAVGSSVAGPRSCR